MNPAQVVQPRPKVAIWVDTHAHMDAPALGFWPFNPDFDGNTPLVSGFIGFDAIKNIPAGFVPSVEVGNFHAARATAVALSWTYGLGIHPLYTPQAGEFDLDMLAAALNTHAADPQLVAVGEIGLDLFVPALCTEAALAKQERFYRQQLKLAKRHDLPVVVHVRRSADLLLKHLRQIEVVGGIAHAFNGSLVQARAFIDRGFKLGFGGAMTYPQATQLRLLAKELPLESIVLETDSPDIVPQWLYTPALAREQGVPQGINTPAQLPRIAQVLASLRGLPLEEVQAATANNAFAALPKLGAWVDNSGQHDQEENPPGRHPQ